MSVRFSTKKTFNISRLHGRITGRFSELFVEKWPPYKESVWCVVPAIYDVETAMKIKLHL